MAINFGATNSTHYISLGSTFWLPSSGNWAIGMFVRIPSDSFDCCLLSVGTAGSTIITENSNLNIMYVHSGSSNAVFPCRGNICVTGYDNSGNGICSRSLAGAGAYFGASTKPYCLTSEPIKGDGLNRLIVLQMNGGRLELWECLPGRNPSLIAYDYFSSFAGLGTSGSPLSAILGALNSSSVTDFCQGSLHIQRFFRTAQAFTAAQIESIANGVAPTSVATFSSGNGDFYWALDDTAAPTTGNTETDSVSGFTATFEGTGSWTAETGQVVATSAVTDGVRISTTSQGVNGYGEIWQRNGASTHTASGTGTFLASNPANTYDVYMQIIDFTTNSTVYVAWTKVAANITGGTLSSGSFNWQLAGLPVGLHWFDVEIALYINGVSQGTVQLHAQVTAGIILFFAGQSIAEKKRYLAVLANSGTSLGCLSFFSSNNPKSAGSPYTSSSQRLYQSGWIQTDGNYGYGEVVIAQNVAAQAGCPAGVIMEAVSGSAIETWDGTNAAPNNWTVAQNSWLKYKPRYFLWEQGQGDLGTLSYAQYQTHLSTMYAQVAAVTSWTWFFIVLPLNNGQTTTQPGSQMDGLRRAQIDWVTQMRAAGYSNIFDGASSYDCWTVDGIHPNAVANGFGAEGERIAQTILWLEGVLPRSGVGPVIAEAHWDGDLQVDMLVTHNGAFGLQARNPNLGGATGFEISPDGFQAMTCTGTSGSTHLGVTLATRPGKVINPGDFVNIPAWATTGVNGGGLEVASGGGATLNSSGVGTVTLTASLGATVNSLAGYHVLGTKAMASQETLAINGSVTAGDVISLGVTSSQISGSPVTVSHTAAAGESSTAIAAAMGALVNGSGSTLYGAGFAASVANNQMTLVYPASVTATFGFTASPGAETGTLTSLTGLPLAQVVDGHRMRVTLNQAPQVYPGDALAVAYMRGNPGSNPNAAGAWAAGVYDTGAPLINSNLGFPLRETTAFITAQPPGLSSPAKATAAA